MYYLLLDEVQNLGAFESVLNGFLRKKNLDVYVTGSNSRFLSKDILTEFEGRGDEIHVLPLSFSEYFGAYDGSKDEAFDDYSVFGGLPAVAFMRTEEQKSAYLTTQMQNLYLRDVINRYHLQEDCAIGELLDVISSGISTLTNPRKLSATFASVKRTTISEVTVDKYIEHMEDAFMINRVKRYDVKGRKYYIQSAYAIPDENKYKQETQPFDKTNDSFKKIILVEKSMKPRRDEKGYVMMGVKEFLLDVNSLEC